MVIHALLLGRGERIVTSVNVVHTVILTSTVPVAVLLLHLPSVAGSPLSFDGGVVW